MRFWFLFPSSDYLKANKSLQALSQEHGFWLDPLRATWPSQPLPCPSAEDLTVRTADSLKQLALHTLRLTRNWREAFPRVVGPTWIHKCGQHNDILYCVPGTDLIVMYSLREGTAICCDVITGFASYPVYIGRIVDTSSPIEEQGSFTVALLVGLRDNTINYIEDRIPPHLVDYCSRASVGYNIQLLFGVHELDCRRSCTDFCA
ncbi:hypothetical protein B0H10DRAFT_494373 [Mycena sp. CBHHK59/15]|nr:hypothetical protein B0H10DRAFT_494373 [Mycena sp. CBHHK59/15]